MVLLDLQVLDAEGAEERMEFGASVEPNSALSVVICHE